MVVVIKDRRFETSGKSIPNRERFKDRAREELKEAAEDALASDTDILKPGGTKVVVKRGINEPRFGLSGGDREEVLPGNKTFQKGDKLDRPRGASDPSFGGRGGERSLDEFHFVLNEEEFLDLLFDGCELPDLSKLRLGRIEETRLERAGFSRSGPPSMLDKLRTMRKSIGRRLALHRPKRKDVKGATDALEALRRHEVPDEHAIKEAGDLLAQLLLKRKRVPFIDPETDMQYRRKERVPKPVTQAVMFCLMDVSGSMGEKEKSLAKRFYLLLYLFLRRTYRYVEVVFIRYTDEAKEVDEQTFFRSRETGGTVASSGLESMKRIISERFRQDWNIYAAQVADGDTSHGDEYTVVALLNELLPFLQYYAYLEVGKGPGEISALWKMYTTAIKSKKFARERAWQPADVLKVFRRLFAKKDGRTR